MSSRLLCSWCAVIVATVVFGACSGTESPTAPAVPTVPPVVTPLTIPELTREFRGLWVATVANIDWPSRTGLTIAAQQAELTAILDLAQKTRLNAVVLQVRASGDALFPSPLEPWSKSFSGTQGVDPGWDPLSFAVAEAHARGIELHAWFNPFRAGNLSDTLRLAPLHFASRRKDLVRYFCTSLWFDPGESAVHDQAIAVIKDVVQRYAIDAVHMDDFFYPYPDTRCPNLDFPDSAGFARYQSGGGALARADWRRDNVNRFVERLYREVRALSPTVRVGISPFGIWRPGNPAGVTGLDAYASIYADSRLWLQRGWVDYLAPQLYWSIASTGQSFPALVDWWTQQNTLRRHFWPGLAAYRVADGTSSAYPASEIASQVTLVRQRGSGTGGPTGTVLYNTSTLLQNRDGLATVLGSGVFLSDALVPPTTWLDAQAPTAPTIAVTPIIGSTTVQRLTIAGDGGEPLAWWTIRWRSGTTWSMRTIPSASRTADIPIAVSGVRVDAVVVQAIDQVGNASPAAVWRAPSA